MTKQEPKPGKSGKTLKLFLMILVVLLVPVVMDQVEVDPENVKMAGRVAGGLTILMFLYGAFTKVLKVMGFVVVILIALVVLMAEGQLKFPRAKELLSSSGQK